MKTTFLSLTLASFYATTALAAPAGFTTLTFDAPLQDAPIEGAIWYPSNGGGTPLLFADNPVFYGIDVLEGADLSDGQHPVILLSHGMGANIRSVAWLASSLASKGAIVVSVNHPNSTTGDNDLQAGLNHGTRAQDLSRALDVLEDDPRFAGHIDSTRIMSAGFSFGGWTALSLAGITGDQVGYIIHCDLHSMDSSHCTEILSAGIKLDSIPPQIWDASYADPRVTIATAIDPGLIWGLTAQNTKTLIANVNLISLGTGADRKIATDFDASGLTALLPDAHITRIAPAMHFTALPLCKPAAEEILKEEGDDPVCTDPKGTDRAAVHATIINEIAGELGL